jgi:hypothetical protein
MDSFMDDLDALLDSEHDDDDPDDGTEGLQLDPMQAEIAAAPTAPYAGTAPGFTVLQLRAARQAAAVNPADGDVAIGGQPVNFEPRTTPPTPPMRGVPTTARAVIANELADFDEYGFQADGLGSERPHRLALLREALLYSDPHEVNAAADLCALHLHQVREATANFEAQRGDFLQELTDEYLNAGFGKGESEKKAKADPRYLARLATGKEMALERDLAESTYDTLVRRVELLMRGFRDGKVSLAEHEARVMADAAAGPANMNLA